MLIAYRSECLTLYYPASWLVVLPGFAQPEAWGTSLHQQRARHGEQVAQLVLEAGSSLPTTLEELTRDLAGWSVPPAGPADAARLGAHWLW